MDINPWVITKDRIAEPEAPKGTYQNAVNICGPYEYEGNGQELIGKCRFRMLDDDGNIYYYGWSAEVGFEPLDDFGMPNAGCTMIEYFLKGQWERI